MSLVKELRKKLPKKTSKPIHPVYGKALGYRCPACKKKKGYDIPPNALYGGSMCKVCHGPGVLRDKEKWIAFMVDKLTTKSIKQEEKSDCCAAVAAMLTNTSLKLFKQEYGPTPELGYWNCNLFDYAEAFGLYISKWYEGKHFKGRLRKGQKAYVAVVSERKPDKTHAIYWDGYQIYDPSPLVEDGRDIKTYDVIRVVYFTENGVPRKSGRTKNNTD